MWTLCISSWGNGQFFRTSAPLYWNALQQLGRHRIGGFLIFLYHRQFGYWACWGCCRSCAAVMRNVVILWLQSWNTDVRSHFLFIRPVLAAVSTQGSSGIKSQIHCFGAGNSRPLALFLSTCAIFPFALEPSVIQSGVLALSCSGTLNHDVTECELPGISVPSQTFPHHLGLKTSHQRFIAFLFALYFLLSR